MDMEPVVIEREIGGRTLRLETGKLAKQAAGAVIVKYGDTTVLCTVVTADPRPGIDFFPLTVDYRERIYAAGKFPGGFFKREGRPTTKEILTCRLIDRPLRPLFPEGYVDEVLVQVMVLSADSDNDPDILSLIGSAAALCISKAPYDTPLGAARVGLIDGEFVLNPSEAQLEYSEIDMVVAGHKDALNMIEVGASEVDEDTMADALQLGQKAVASICEMVEELSEKCSVPVEWQAPEIPASLKSRVKELAGSKLREARRIGDKLDRKAAIKAIYGGTIEAMIPADADPPEYTRDQISGELDRLEGQILVDMIMEDDLRSDGRGPNDLREIISEVGLLPRVHGSALFTRGETQALVVLTVGTSRDEQRVDGLGEEFCKKFMLHYTFPPFCVGEVKRVGAVSRREIGHGALAERSLERVLPAPDKFPYTIRLASEILESNGSSSMASVCGGTLALMDAGVPISQPVAGISIGMVHCGDDYKLIADITGEEDHFGDMDFKVSGTQRGITGIQLDIKIRGLNDKQIREAFAMAKEKRLEILRNMLQALPRPRKELSSYAPRILTIKIKPEKIGKVIGPGGSGIKGIEAATGARVDIDDDGTIQVASTNSEAAQRALEMIELVTQEVKEGKIYDGRVTSIKDFGAFIEVAPGQDGLCHISELSDGFIKQVGDVCAIGDRMRVKVIAIDNQGRIKLSRRQAIIEEEGGKDGGGNGNGDGDDSVDED
jgi:polyribonucleotide nucleotidyltransferase